MKKLTDGGKIIIDSVDIGLSYKIFFVIGMLLIFFMHLRQIAKSLMLSMSSSSIGHNPAI